MRTISTPLLQHLQGDVRTLATLWLITRTNGKVFGFTDHDTDITFSGTQYLAAGYTASAIDMTGDMSTSNMEVDAILNNGVIEQADIEAGIWNYAAVTISLCNFMDLTMGALVVTSGVIGEFALYNGQFKAELRGLAQIMQQPMGDVYSATCRATFGDSKCTIDLTPLTFDGSVQTVTGPRSWTDSTLTQVGPTVSYVDTDGQKIPTETPFTIQVVPPTGGAFVSNTSVVDDTGNSWTEVGGSPASDQYTVTSGGLYGFDGTDNPGQQVFINYSYSIGYFAYGLVTFLTGQNAGYSMEVKTFAPGVVTLAMQLPFPIAPGDTYTIVAGCDKQFGTCLKRYDNVIHFRGEPYIPGIDAIIKPKAT